MRRFPFARRNYWAAVHTDVGGAQRINPLIRRTRAQSVSSSNKKVGRLFFPGLQFPLQLAPSCQPFIYASHVLLQPGPLATSATFIRQSPQDAPSHDFLLGFLVGFATPRWGWTGNLGNSISEHPIQLTSTHRDSKHLLTRHRDIGCSYE